MTIYIGMLDTAQVEDDGPDGTYLILHGEAGRVSVQISDEAVEALDLALQPLRDWAAESRSRRKVRA